MADKQYVPTRQGLNAVIRVFSVEQGETRKGEPKLVVRGSTSHARGQGEDRQYENQWYRVTLYGDVAEFFDGKLVQDDQFYVTGEFRVAPYVPEKGPNAGKPAANIEVDVWNWNQVLLLGNGDHQ